MPFSWLRVAKAQEGRAEQETKEKAARENVWTRDSDLMGKLKAQEEEVRVGGRSSHARTYAQSALCVRICMRACFLQRATWWSTIFLAYGSLGVIYVSALGLDWRRK